MAARAAAMFGATVGPAIGGGAAVEGAVGAVGAAAVVADAAAETPVRPEQKNRKRCFTCSKKVDKFFVSASDVVCSWLEGHGDEGYFFFLGMGRHSFREYIK